MKKQSNINAGLFFTTALIMLLFTLMFGVLAAHSYSSPGIWKEYLSFIQLRPMHVSAALFWILLAASGSVYAGLLQLCGNSISKTLMRAQWTLWVAAIVLVFYSYLTQQFGGREYWEFPPQISLLIALAWVIFIFQFVKAVRTLSTWPVYIWMWFTGLVFFLFTFIENYLWVFPYFSENFVRDTTIQWKVNGSLVGSWNQLVYGSAFYLMERIGGDKKSGYSALAFAMYFLGLFNLMFNWGHHIYTLPTQAYVRYVSYLVSMTEWVFFLRIVYNWKKSLNTAQKHIHYFPYLFLLAADVWVFFNLTLALLMSVPAINLYTHGTHVTVAHAMGTTIGINTMILLAACFEFMSDEKRLRQVRMMKYAFWLLQISLLVFWLTLLVMGATRGAWQMQEQRTPFSVMMAGMQFWFRVFVYSGSLIMLSLGYIAIVLLRIRKSSATQ